MINYEPLDCTKALLLYTRFALHAPSQNLLDTAKKVAQFTLALLALIPCLILDLALSAKMYYCTKPGIRCFVLSMPAHQHNLNGKPSEDLVEGVLCYYHYNPPVNLSLKDFFSDSLKSAFRFHLKTTKDAYKELILNGGVVERGDPPTEIYSWCAGCLLAHYIVSISHLNAIKWVYYSLNTPETMNISASYNLLSQEERASVILQIIVPETHWDLTERSKILVGKIRTQALALTQDPDFIKNIYTPVTKPIFLYDIIYNY